MSATTELPELLTAAQVGEALGVDKDRVWALTREGKLRAVKLGKRTYRYRADRVREDVEAMER